MIGARLRISDVETCNTSVFCGFYCMLEQAVSPNIQQLGGVIYFLYSVKDPPVISRKFYRNGFCGQNPKARQFSPLYNLDVSPFALWRILPVYCSPNV